jgi:hypothetical protein
MRAKVFGLAGLESASQRSDMRALWRSSCAAIVLVREGAGSGEGGSCRTRERDPRDVQGGLRKANACHPCRRVAILGAAGVAVPVLALKATEEAPLWSVHAAAVVRRAAGHFLPEIAAGTTAKRTSINVGHIGAVVLDARVPRSNRSFDCSLPDPSKEQRNCPLLFGTRPLRAESIHSRTALMKRGGHCCPPRRRAIALVRLTQLSFPASG